MRQLWFPVTAGLVFLLVVALGRGYGVFWDRVVLGQNDFVSFYVGGRLVGTPDLYSQPANSAAIQKILGRPSPGTTYVRPPFYAAVMWPLARLPYRLAYGLFAFSLLASVLWFVVRFRRECHELPLFAAFGIPFLSPLCNGQDTPYLLALTGAAILLLRRNRDFAAGLVLSLCSIKCHLFIFVPVLFLLKKRWRAISGGLCGGAVLMVLGVLAAGPDSIRQWIRALCDPWIMPQPERLPNIHGLVLSLHGGAVWEVLLSVLIGAVFCWMTSRTENFELLLACSLVCGLLTSFHSGVWDDILLYPVFILILGSCRDLILRSISAFLILPIPYLAAFAGSPYSIAIPVMLMAWLIAAGAVVYGGSQQVRPMGWIGEPAPPTIGSSKQGGAALRSG